MSDQEFFNESTEQSRIKAAIVHDYFRQWSKVILGFQKLKSAKTQVAYIDLFAGPGIYKDGRVSTPMLILQSAIGDPDLCESLIAIFNDKDSANTGLLKKAIVELDNIQRLKTQPIVHNMEVGQQIVDSLKSRKLLPTLLFVDPWGYKGLTLELLNAVLKDWGCECIFFFNFNRINMGLANDLVDDHMDALFGKERADRLRMDIRGLKNRQREELVLQEIQSALKDSFGKYFLSFKFKYDTGSRTSHYLIFATKHFKGYEIMKHIMSEHSSTHIDGVPSFEYNPPSVRHQLMLALTKPIDELATTILNDFAGKSIEFKDLYERHSVGKRFIKRNYQDALLNLESTGEIETNPSKRQVRNGRKTLGDKVKLTFPMRG